MSSLADFWSLPPSKQSQEMSRIEQLSQKGRNPCILQFGEGPWDRECGECSHMYQNRHDKVYWKCSMRKHTNGAGSDHRRTWPACARFELKK
jgi:hypothetical protein